MQIKQFLLSDAKDKYLCAEYTVSGKILPRGHKLTAEDIKALKSLGLKNIFAAEFEEGDVNAATALEIIATRLCGENLGFVTAENGLCKIASQKQGVLCVEEERVLKFNRLFPELILNTHRSWKRVGEQEIVAELELLSPAMAQKDIDKIILHLSGNLPMLNIATNYPKKTAFIYPNLQKNAAETEHFTNQVAELIRTLAPLNLEFSGEYQSSYEVEDLSSTIEMAEKEGYEIIFIVSPIQNVSTFDVIPQAMTHYVDELVLAGLPSVGGSDLYIGTKRSARIISLPYDFAVTNSEEHYQNICKAIVLEKCHSFDFEHKENIHLPPNLTLTEDEQQHIIAAAPSSSSSKNANIAVVILAAGSSSRAKCNKLLKEYDGAPVFMKAVQAALASKASPIYLISGYQHEDLEEYLQDIDINIVYNSDYRSGIKTSIRLGLSLVPNSCQGAVLLPADMPNIKASDINKLIDKFNPNLEKQVIMYSYKDVKKNPILWSKSLFSEADLVPENVATRGAFIEHTDYTTLIKTTKENILWDVTYPADIEKLKKP